MVKEIKANKVDYYFRDIAFIHPRFKAGLRAIICFKPINGSG